jgi:hypothetical protein
MSTAPAAELVFMASYQAATSYLKYQPKSPSDVLLLDPALQLFGEYFATYASCHVIDGAARAADCLAQMQRLSYGSIAFWSYALSDLGLLAANFARRRGIRSRFVLPSGFIDELYASDEFDLRVALRSPRSLGHMLLQKLQGYPLRIKTRTNYLYSCIDTGFAESVTTFRALSARNERADAQFAEFAAFVRQKHASVIDELAAAAKPCIVLDEDLEFFHRRAGLRPEEGKRLLLEALEQLHRCDYSVYLKPTYAEAPYLSRIYSFGRIIPGEIPLEVLDLILRPNTLVTGFSSSYLTAKTRNLRPVGIAQLLGELQ